MECRFYFNILSALHLVSFFEWRFALHHFIDKMLMLFCFISIYDFFPRKHQNFPCGWVSAKFKQKTIKIMRICKSIFLPEQKYLDWRALNKIFYALLRSKFWRIFNSCSGVLDDTSIITLVLYLQIFHFKPFHQKRYKKINKKSFSSIHKK